MKKYEGKELEEIENEEDRKIVEIIRRLDEEYAYGEKQLHYNLGIILEIENWCKKNYGEQPSAEPEKVAIDYSKYEELIKQLKGESGC